MVPRVRRLRGRLLRLILRRPAAITLGLCLLAPAVYVTVVDLPWESGATEGAALILGATGAALVLAGIGGRRPDWVE